MGDRPPTRSVSAEALTSTLRVSPDAPEFEFEFAN